MRIKTKPYALTQEQFFRIAVRDFIQRQWWGYLLAAAVLLLLAIVSGQDLVSILVLAVCAIVLLVVFPLYRVRSHARDPRLHRLFQERRAEIDMDSITFQTSSGAVDQVSLYNVAIVEMTLDYCLFYLHSQQFYYLDLHAFYSDEDRQRFEDILHFHRFI